MGNVVFLTGFPGFIAGRLLKRLAQEELRFILLVQPALYEQAVREIDDIARQTGRDPCDFQIAPGDITGSDLALRPRDLQTIRAETNIVFHLAAVYDLAVARDIALRVNLEGTRNVNTFVRTLPNLKHYHYVSTCYVAGKRKGMVLETELAHDAGFRNHYEQSKYLAELEVERLKSELPVTIHRPAVVCGDSQTGETAKFDGVYYLIRYLLRAPRLLSILNIGNDEVRLNLVPVDFVVESFAATATDSGALGKTLQLADPVPLTTRELFNSISESICRRRSLISVPPRIVEFALMLPPSPAITGLPHYAVPYFFLQQSYDSTEAQNILRRHQISCPSFNTYVDNIVGYAAAHPKSSSRQDSERSGDHKHTHNRSCHE